MNPITRRSFVAGASLAAGTATVAGTSRADCSMQRGGLANDLSAELGSLIAQKRGAVQEAMAKYAIPGAAVSLIYGGKVVWTEGFGVTDLTSGKAVGTQTLFNIQSASKNFAATAVLFAVQQGILDLDAPITTYLPEFSVHSRFETAPQEKMTLRLLLGHRAGFTHEAPVGNNYRPDSPSFEAHVRSISDTWLRYPVGERYSYSNLGIDLAGYILQKVSGVPYAQWVKSKIFDPLGMTASTCSMPVYVARDDRAVGHKAGYDVVPLEIPMIPSGGINTNASDWAAYARFHLSAGELDGKPLLNHELWQAMHSFPVGVSGYGLGIARRQHKFGAAVIEGFHHEGEGFGFGSIFSFYPRARLAWVVLFNRSVEIAAYEALGSAIADDILTRMYGEPAPLLPTKSLSSIRIPSGELERLAGTYITRDCSVYEVKIRNGGLAIQMDSELVDLHFSSPVDAFFGAATAEATVLSYEPARERQTARWKCRTIPSRWDVDYNDGPNDPKGPDRKRWHQHLGEYAVMFWGQRSEKMTVHLKNGYLYLDELRMIHEPARGLFFSANGEALDFRKAQATWRNIPLLRL